MIKAITCEAKLNILRDCLNDSRFDPLLRSVNRVWGSRCKAIVRGTLVTTSESWLMIAGAIELQRASLKQSLSQRAVGHQKDSGNTPAALKLTDYFSQNTFLGCNRVKQATLVLREVGYNIATITGNQPH